MNIGIYSLCGESMMLIQRIREAGHDVAMYISDESSRPIGDGLVWKLPHPNLLQQADVILFDDNGKGEYADSLRSQGKKVWCGGVIADRLEKDRLFGMKTFNECGVPIPDTYEVSSLGDVQAVCKSEFSPRDKVVIKLDDSVMCSVSYVAKDVKDLLEQVAHWEQDGAIKAPWSGIVQRFVTGIEVSVEGWWNGEGWENTNITFEEKKCWPGNLGPAVGCSINTIIKISPKSKLFKMMVDPIQNVLRGTPYTGQLDVNTIVGEAGPVALEFTPRPGYDATPTMAWGDGLGYADRVLKALGIEDEGCQLDPRPGPFWAGVRVSIPPYPFETKEENLAEMANGTCRGVPVGVGNGGNFYLYDVMSTERGLICAGTLGVVGVAMGGGDTPSSAGKAAYRVAEKLSIPNKAYRALDGFDRVSEEFPELLRDGWVTLEKN